MMTYAVVGERYYRSLLIPRPVTSFEKGNTFLASPTTHVITDSSKDTGDWVPVLRTGPVPGTGTNIKCQMDFVKHSRLSHNSQSNT